MGVIMAKYLGLDISLNSTGYAVIDDKLNLFEFGCIEYQALTEKKKDLIYHEKTNLQLEAIRNIFNRNEIDEIFIERFSFGSFGSSNAVSVIAEVTGCIKLLLYNLSKPYTTIAPLSVKKHITGSGKSKKEDLYHSLILMYPQISGCRFDVSDALAVAISGYERGVKNE
jgi:Holliday junction resolvasome RuvABC endonuclease subunit